MLDYALRNKYIALGHAVFITLLVFSQLFVKERVFLIDSAYQIFDDVLREGIYVAAGRHSMVLSQLLPWAAIKLGAPLPVVVGAYSGSFVLVCYLLFAVAAHGLRDQSAALVMVSMAMVLRHTFFHCISETFQLMVYAGFLYALLRRAPRPGGWRAAGRMAAVAAALLLCLFIHPVSMFFVAFILGFLLIDSGWRPGRCWWWAAAVFAVAAGAKWLATRSGSHDDSFVPTADTMLAVLADPRRSYALSFIAANAWRYLFPLAMLAASLLFYLRRRQWWKLAFAAGFNAAFFAVTLLVYHKPDGVIAMERSFLPLVFFAALPFAHDVVPTLRGRREWLCAALAAISLAGGLTSLALASRQYTRRIAAMDRVIDFALQTNQRKLVMARSEAAKIFEFQIWGVGVESMLLSSMRGPGQTVNLFLEDDGFDRRHEMYRYQDTYMPVPWWKVRPTAKLNHRYMNLPQQPFRELLVGDDGNLATRRMKTRRDP